MTSRECSSQSQRQKIAGPSLCGWEAEAGGTLKKRAMNSR